MKTTAGVLLALLALSGVQGAPMKPLYQPPSPPGAEAGYQLGGTVWRGVSLSKLPFELVFEHGGTLRYHVVNNGPGGRAAGPGSPGSWKIFGNQVIFDINKYTDHDGVITGNEMRGTAVNRANQRGTFSLKRVSP